MALAATLAAVALGANSGLAARKKINVLLNTARLANEARAANAALDQEVEKAVDITGVRSEAQVKALAGGLSIDYAVAAASEKWQAVAKELGLADTSSTTEGVQGSPTVAGGRARPAAARPANRP